MPSRVEGILLAAGESRRMGFPKLLLRLHDRTFIGQSAARMLEAVPRLVIVIGAFAERIRRAIPSDPRIAVVENPDYRHGQLSSMRVGLSALSGEADAAIVHLGDHPMVESSTFRAMVEAYARGSHPIVIARYRGKRGHPVIFARSLFEEVIAAPDAEGARVVVNRDLRRVSYLDVDDPGVTLDLDTPEDLARAGIELPLVKFE